MLFENLNTYKHENASHTQNPKSIVMFSRSNEILLFFYCMCETNWLLLFIFAWTSNVKLNYLALGVKSQDNLMG